MKYFTKDFNDFFKELAPNNHKDWFDENRERYHKSVKEPFEKFISDLVDELKKEDPRLNINPKKAIFRINRDIRFSKDKSPYKLNRSAAIAPDGKKSISRGGLYVELGPERVMIGGGAFQPEKDELRNLREYIAAHPDKFRKVVEDPAFLDVFEEVHGEENKRLPSKELTAAAKKEPLLYKKSLYYFAEFPPDLVTSDGLMEFVLQKHAAARPLREFIAEAVG